MKTKKKQVKTKELRVIVREICFCEFKKPRKEKNTFSKEKNKSARSFSFT